MNHPSEYARLIVLTLDGSRDAFGELYEATIKDVYKTVYFLIREPSDVEDVIQEIYIQVYRSLKKFDISRPFRPWLMGVVMRQIQTHRRKSWTHVRIIKKAEQIDQAVVYDFSSEVVNKVSNRSLLASVDRLPYKLKLVVILHYMNDYTQEEIAAALEIPLGTVKSRIHAALQKIRKKQKISFLAMGKVEELNESR
ncbi:sigma-70 family RNA polymerase sigma factor [Paenibacillus sp.]|jgi:RNA polymerase sigma-70 factor (ECF subfamily)|uniref:sigma-70 family RNA polymerase sigma factor n=1 Tax=Paenibacillus sp. TaxID=58172 RepID=UPI00282A3AED|nr:sigma-70 family RNA polymerase sigma factor [Paenibacillus sp.]MDR0269395.1 sigma-70 family RNA polymerase sigma factor [Paenibacillus sp.]